MKNEMTPSVALQILRDGNFRFINNLKENRNLLEQVNETQDEQLPFAAILSCMDSRTSAELIFDQGLGDIFSIRIAGNVITENILGSLEYATVVAGSKLVVVLGHTGCGAIKGACDDVQMGHLTTLLEKIQPAVHAEKTIKENRNGSNPKFVNEVATIHVHTAVQHIVERSTIIKQLADEGKVGIVPAMYDLSTGTVKFFVENAIFNDKEKEIVAVF